MPITLLKISIILCSLSINCFGSEYNCRNIYNTQDVTIGIQDAINSGANKIIIPYMGVDKKWISGPLYFNSKSAIELILEPGVILESKSGAFRDTFTSFMTIINCRNIKISGIGAEVRMLKNEYDEGEWRHGINIISSDSIMVTGLTISKTGGDGIYIGSNDTLPAFSSNIIIENVTFDENARNGISVISCKNLLVENCILKNTGYNNNRHLAKNGPWAGIDLEPNYLDQKLEGIVINHCTLYNNRNDGILLSFLCDTSTVTITNNMIYDNKLSGIRLNGLLGEENGQLFFQNNSIYGHQGYGFLFINWNITNLKINIDNCSVDSKEIENPIRFSIDKEETYNRSFSSGNVSFTNIHFSNSKNNCLIYLKGEDSIYTFKNIEIDGTSNGQLIKGSYEFNNSYAVTQHTNIGFYKYNPMVINELFCKADDNLDLFTYPNPFRNNFNVEIDTYNEVEISIYSISGQRIFNAIARKIVQIDCKAIPNGLYIITAKDLISHKKTEKRIIKEN